MNVDKGCVTHHFACDCREAAIKKLIKDMLLTLLHDTSIDDWETINEYKQRAKELFRDLK